MVSSVCFSPSNPLLKNLRHPLRLPLLNAFFSLLMKYYISLAQLWVRLALTWPFCSCHVVTVQERRHRTRSVDLRSLPRVCDPTLHSLSFEYHWRMGFNVGWTHLPPLFELPRDPAPALPHFAPHLSLPLAFII